MAILFDEKNKIFNIQTKNSSLVFGIYEDKLPVMLHYGKRLKDTYSIEKTLDFTMTRGTAHNALLKDFDSKISTEIVSTLYPTYGNCDLRIPAISIVQNNGTMCSSFYYKSHKIIKGKNQIEGLPQTYVEEGDNVESLELCLYDDIDNIELILNYSAFYDYDIIAQSVKVTNKSDKKIKIDRIMSASVDLKYKNFDFIHLHGAWCNECNVQRVPVLNGGMTIDSKRGCSSPNHNPFFALAEKSATEDMGEVYGFNLIYSGNFVAGVEVDSIKTTRAYIGINPFNFGWTLEAGESFTSPEAMMNYSCEGIGKMSDNFHKIIRKRVCRGKYRDIRRPLLLNNWEATYFDFDEDKLLEIAKKAKETGIELFVLDDGWFGKRNTDNCSLGDWYVNKEKLPSGIDGLAKKINDLGLKFGLWFEPETICVDSDLYRAHPDWCLHIEGRPQNECRNELLLDLSRDEVCDYVIDIMTKNLSEANISYVKWDMNRSMSDIGSCGFDAERQCEIAHRYILGLYRIMDTLTKRFPDVLFEGCASGGARFDAGILYYFPQIWTSDCSDAVERMFIQHGASMLYPTSAMSAHVSASPNHQVKRSVSMKTRGNVAMCGTFGYELDLNKLTEEEMEEVKHQIEIYKDVVEVTQRGTMHRLLSPYEQSYVAWEYVSEDENKVIVMFGIVTRRGGTRANTTKLILKGLQKDADYVLESTGEVYSGDFLMNFGLYKQLEKDFDTELMVFKKVK